MLTGATPQWLQWMFGRIARRYDLTNTIISAGLNTSWQRRLARMLSAPCHHDPEGSRTRKPRRGWSRYPDEAARQSRCTALRSPSGRLVLDVACGTGGVMLQVARRTPASTRLIGIDFTEAMLRVGRQRLARHGLQPRTALGVAEAQQLPFPDHTFDAVTMMFGLRNFGCPAAALAECQRVLGPGDMLYIVEFSWPQARGVRLLYGGYLRYLLPLIAWPLSGDRSAYRYLRDSVLAFRRQCDPVLLLRRTGFLDVSRTPLSGGITALYVGRKVAT